MSTKTRHKISALHSVCAGILLALAPIIAAAGDGEVRLLASGLMGTIGSTIGPDGALYVAEGAVGRITRIDRSTGKATTFASGLPAAVPGVGLGGAIRKFPS